MRAQTLIVSGEPQRASVIAFLQRAPLTKPLRVTIQEHVKKRSLSQMGLYWMWLTDVAKKVAEETGNTPDDIHQAFKERFLSPAIVEIGDRQIRRYSTKDLNVQEMTAYLEQIYAFVVTELGILLPLPEERMVR